MLSFGLTQLGSALLLLNITHLWTKWCHMSINETRCFKWAVHILTGLAFLFVFIFFSLNTEDGYWERPKDLKAHNSTNSRLISHIFTPTSSILSHFPSILWNTYKASQSVKNNTIFLYQLHCFLTPFSHALFILSIKNIYFWLQNKLLDIKK